MLLLHEVHTVAGRHEDEFEDAFRTRYMSALADDGDARLLYYLKLAHGTGRAYHHTTITALSGGAAYERLARRIQTGDLRSWAADIDGMRREVKGKLLLPVEWSPVVDIDLASVPTDGREHDAVLYMEDERVAVRRQARHLPRKGAHALRTESRAAFRTLTPHVARGVSSRARCTAAPRGHPVAARRFPGTASRSVHARAARARERPGHVDARRAGSARRLGEPPAAQRGVVAVRITAVRLTAGRGGVTRSCSGTALGTHCPRACRRAPGTRR